jgi:subtilisin family serine protease
MAGRRRIRWLGSAIALLVVWLATTAVLTAAPSSQVSPAPPSARYVPDEILVRYRDGVGELEKRAARGRAGAAIKERLSARRENGKGDLELAKLPSGETVPGAIQKLQHDRAVVYAEPNWIYTHTATANDPYFADNQLWGMYGPKSTPANEYGSQAAQAWASEKTGSRSVYVGVIDEGIDINHPDLRENIWTNPNEIPGNGLDDDGNGYVDDLHGWDYYNGDNSVYDPANGDHHGTHVAGTIGATGGNGRGVAGVSWKVTLIPLKFLGPDGGYTSDAVKALDYLVQLKTTRGLNVVASNNSWGGGGFSQSLYDAIQRTNQAGMLFIAAAGNDNRNNDSRAHYPSNYDLSNVIAVASITSSGGKSSFSNYGATKVHLGAPGSSIWSTSPGSDYESMSGTSMATPHVTGAVALYASEHPGASATQIKNALLENTTATSSLAGKTVTGGRLSLCEMLTCTDVDTLAVPTNLEAELVKLLQVKLTWDDNSSAESGFKIERSTNGVDFSEIGAVGANTTSYSDYNTPPPPPKT